MKTRYKLLLLVIIASFIFGVVKYGQRGLPVYNVTDFIGVGQGDTVSAINQAIATAAANNPAGAVVYLPEGTWGIANAYRSGVAYRPVGIVGASNVTLRGAGLGQTILIQDAPPAGATFDTLSFATNTHWSSIIRCTNCTNFKVENLSINGTINRQINKTSSPYSNPQDGLGSDTLQADPIYFLGGRNNSIYNVRIDSSVGYGVRLSSCYQCSTDKIISNYHINAGYYATGTNAYSCAGSTLTNSLITNSFCDNVRLRVGNISVINNEVSWSQFSNGITANFAGIYIENDAGTLTSGILVENNRTHDNSSNGIECFNADTTNYTFVGNSVNVLGNVSYRNGGNGIATAMQHENIEGNSIYDNGADSLGRTDNIGTHGNGIFFRDCNDLKISNNKIRNSTGGPQLHGMIVGNTHVIPLLDIHGNIAMGGIDFINVSTASIKSTAPFNTFYGNTFMDSNKLVRSDWQTDNNGVLYMYNYAPGLNGIASGQLQLVGDNDAQFFGNHLITATRAFYIGDATTSGAGMGFKIGENQAGAGIAQRAVQFYDFQLSTVRGFVNANGDFYWGSGATMGSTADFVVHPITTDLSNYPAAVEIQVPTSGTTGKTYVGESLTLLSGFTGLAVSTGALITNQVFSTTTAQVDIGLKAQTTGANTFAGSLSLALQGVATGALNTVGVQGIAGTPNNASATAIGMVGNAFRNNAGAIEVGVAAVMNTGGAPAWVSTALYVDNVAEAIPIAVFRANGVTKIQIDQNGNLLTGAAATTDLGSASLPFRDIYLSHTVGESAIGVSSGLGTNVSSLTPSGNDEYFQITVVTSGNVLGTVGLIAFGRTWGATPHCVLGLSNAATGTAVTGGYYGINATSASSMTMVASLTGAGTYVFQCHCGQ